MLSIRTNNRTKCLTIMNSLSNASFSHLNLINNYLLIETGFHLITELSEEWALATSLKDLSENHYDIDESETDAAETFSLKYLGNTVIESARSQEATADAVKAIISTAKGKIF